MSWIQACKALLRTIATLLRSGCVAGAILLAACSSDVILQAGLSDSDANDIIALLHDNGIVATKLPGKDGVTVKVPDTELAASTELMKAAGLPHRRLDDLGQVFKKDGMISTPFEERVRYIHGLSQELEYTLSQIDHVITAQVHVVLPDRVAPGEPIQPSSAAVFIKYHPPFDQDTIVPRVRELVANSIPGLSEGDTRSKVSVVLIPGEATARGVALEAVGPFMLEARSAAALRTTLWGLLAVAAFVVIVGAVYRKRLMQLALRRKPAMAAQAS